MHLEAVGMGGIVGAAVRGARCGADAGVAISMPLTEKQWGERAFQVRDPNGSSSSSSTGTPPSTAARRSELVRTALTVRTPLQS